MAEQVEVKGDSLPDLDDLLQCPVCYEIPTGQIFQCNEGHHVCGRCKARLDVCPVCRALFFGTRNYAMEELIANIRKLRAFKLVGKVTAVTSVPESSTPPKESSPEETVPETVVDEQNNEVLSEGRSSAPPACKGLFRCLCCKNGNTERLAAARLLNHLRYYHSPELIEGTSENGEYLQAWQFSTVPGRIVTAVRVADMGIFFLIIEITPAGPEPPIHPEIEAIAREFDLQTLPLRDDTVTAWLAMAAAPWVAHEFCYTVTISGNDREAIFSDSVWSVRSCEGTLKKRGHMLIVSGQDARALTAPAALSGKLSVRRAPADQLANQPQPRAVMRVANRGNAEEPRDLEPFIQDLQNDVARLSRAFATLDREANALVRSEAEMRARIENRAIENPGANEPPVPPVPLSRNARRRMRQRLRAALNEPQDNLPRPSPPTSQSPPVHHIGYITVQPANPSSSTGSTNSSNRNKKKRRQRR